MKPWLLKQIAELVLRLSGVSVRRQHQSSSQCVLDMHVENPASLVRLAWCSTVSNLPFQVFLIANHQKVSDLDSKELIYRLIAEGDPHPPEWLSNIEVYGINLTRVLYEDGLLDFATSEALHERFNRL